MLKYICILQIIYNNAVPCLCSYTETTLKQHGGSVNGPLRMQICPWIVGGVSIQILIAQCNGQCIVNVSIPFTL